MQTYNHSSGYIWEQALPPASGSPPHQAPLASGSPRIRHGSHTCPMPLCHHSPGHTQGSRNSSSCRRCVFRSQRWSRSSWGLFPAEVRPEPAAEKGHLCWWRCVCARARALAPLPLCRLGLLLFPRGHSRVPGLCPSRFMASVIAQAKS